MPGTCRLEICTGFMGGAPRTGFARPTCQVPICHLTGFGKDELDGRLVEGRDRLNPEDRFISRMPDVALIASTLILVETTLYAVAVAVYTLLVQRGWLSPWDRLLVEFDEIYAGRSSGIR